MSVHRDRPLPEGSNRGRLIVPVSVGLQTRIALQGFCGPSSRHEGMVFWVGRRVEADTVVVSAVVPDCRHGPQYVQAPPSAVGMVAKATRNMGLGIVAQVHSHPGDDTRHSTGDDSMILMPFESMFSVVVARYGDGGITQESGVGLHQYQNRQWVSIPSSEKGALLLVPSIIGGLG